mgnify:CR=1 FL=1
MPDWKLLKNFLAREGPITKEQILKLLGQIMNVFKDESNLVNIPEPICIVGDIHG